MKKIRLIELFAGIGSQAKALENLGIDFEHYKVVEFDKYAITSYNAIHGTNFQTCDITKITADELGIEDTDLYTYIMTYSFPCQDLSLAGKQAGMEKGAGTRSGLLWEVERLLTCSKELPQILLMENVPQVHGNKNKPDFDKWCSFLESIGYTNFWKDLNAKNYGIPQNRNRCFMISCLDNKKINFPEPFELKVKLKDILEEQVDKKYYLSDLMLEKITFKEKLCRSGIIEEANLNKGGQKGGVISTEGICSTLTATDYKQPKQIICEQRCDEGLRFFKGNVCGSLRTTDSCGDKRVLIKEATKQGYAVAEMGDSINLEQPNSKTRRGRVGKQVAQTLTTSPHQAVVNPVICASHGRYTDDGKTKQQLEFNTTGCTNTLTSVQKDNYLFSDFSIRKLTPKECWRLMGFTDGDFEKAKKALNDAYHKGVDKSNTQLYKQAGNSIVVNVLMEIFKEVLYASKNNF